MNTICRHAVKFFCVGSLLVSLGACAPLYTESDVNTMRDTSVSYTMSSTDERQLARQVDDALFRAEAHMFAGQARAQENSPREAADEFERARLILTQEVYPKLNYAQQVSVQGGLGILRSNMSGIQVRIRGLEQGIEATELSKIEKNVQQQETIVKRLLDESRTVLQPINPPAPYNGSASSYALTRSSWQTYSRQSGSFDARRRSRFEEDVERHIEILRRQGNAFRQCLLRANSYFPRVMSILASEGVPDFLAYVALLESGYQPEARSFSGKAGLWQLSPSIARQYGLRVNGAYDERLQVQASTRAFARYITQLYHRYGSWERAVAAYSTEQDYWARCDRRRQNRREPQEIRFLRGPVQYDRIVRPAAKRKTDAAPLRTGILGTTGLLRDMMERQSDLFDDFNKRYYLPARPYGLALFRLYFRLKATGIEHIPAGGPIILVPNHGSMLDPPLLSSLVPRVIYFLMLHQHFHHRYFHWLFRRLPCIPVKRGSAASTSSLKACLQVLEHQQILCLFPEGGISRENKAGGLRSGAALLALKTRAPIVPVGICGASEALPLRKKFPRPRPIEIHFGKTIQVPEGDPRDKALLQDIMEHTMDEVRLPDRSGDDVGGLVFR